MYLAISSTVKIRHGLFLTTRKFDFGRAAIRDKNMLKWDCACIYSLFCFNAKFLFAVKYVTLGTYFSYWFIDITRMLFFFFLLWLNVPRCYWYIQVQIDVLKIDLLTRDVVHSNSGVLFLSWRDKIKSSYRYGNTKNFPTIIFDKYTVFFFCNTSFPQSLLPDHSINRSIS